MDAKPASSSELSSFSKVSAMDPPFERSGSSADGFTEGFGGGGVRGGAAGGARNSPWPEWLEDEGGGAALAAGAGEEAGPCKRDADTDTYEPGDPGFVEGVGESFAVGSSRGARGGGDERARAEAGLPLGLPLVVPAADGRAECTAAAGSDDIARAGATGRAGVAPTCARTPEPRGSGAEASF
jgi:hypothetical protein